MKKKLFLFLAIILIICVGFWYFKNLRRQPQIFLNAPTPLISPVPLLKFSVIGDPESDLPNLKKALEMSKNEGDEFTVLVGDLTHVGSEKELTEIKRILDESGQKYYAVPGNHDLYSSKKLTKDPKKYFSEIIGKPYGRVLTDKGVTILLIDNSDEEKGISAEQMNFIKKSLNSNLTASNAAAVFVFLHQPIYHPDATYIMGYRNTEVSRQKGELLSLLKTASVTAVFSGHLHHTSSHENPLAGGLKFYVAGSVSSERNWQTPRFLEVKVFNDGKLSVSETEL